MTYVDFFNKKQTVKVIDDNPDSVFQFMRSFCGDHDMDVREKRSLHFEYSGHAKAANEMTLGYLEYGTPVSVHLGSGMEHFSISLPLRGSQMARTAGASTLSEPSTGLVLSPGRELIIDLDRECSSVFVTVNRELMYRELQRLICRPIERPLVFSMEMPTGSTQASSWWRAVRYYLSEMSSEGSIVCFPGVGADWELSLIRTFLMTQDNNYSEEIAKKVSIALPERIARPKRYMEENFFEKICLDAVRRMSGVTPAKFCAEFKDFVGTTPIDYLKKIRLEKARQELLKTYPRRTIASVALDVGFNHIGRFSLEYKKIFGESPKDTVARVHHG
ncbi:HTH-type transcriptional activator RhaS [compost metagenome]